MARSHYIRACGMEDIVVVIVEKYSLLTPFSPSYVPYPLCVLLLCLDFSHCWFKVLCSTVNICIYRYEKLLFSLEDSHVLHSPRLRHSTVIEAIMLFCVLEIRWDIAPGYMFQYTHVFPFPGHYFIHTSYLSAVF
jgi:hypothetical protein